MLLAVCACAALGVLSALSAGAGAAEEAARALEGAARYAVASTVLLSDADALGGELGYRLQAALTLRAQPAPEGLLLHFTLDSPQLMLRGKHRNAEFLPKPSLWDSMPSSEFLAVWSEGQITEAFLDPGDPPDVLDYKKALISLFQFQVAEGERNETDVSGACRVHYDRVSELVFRKSKMWCTWQGAVDEDENDACAERRRVVRYERAPGGGGGGGGGLAAISADEVLLLRGADQHHALKARALHMLTRSASPPAPAAAAATATATLAAARARLPALAPAALPLELRPEPDDEPKESLSEALSAHRAALEEARAGSAEAAEAALRLLPALRAAAAPQLAAALDHPDTDELSGLVVALGLAGTRGAHAAAREALQLQARAPPREALGREYLAALALAPEVDEWVVRDALALGLAPGALAPAALLAAAAAAARVPATARAQLAADLQHDLTRGLVKCKEDACAAVRLHALGQLRRPALAELFLEHAERGARASALAALAALRALGNEGYSDAHKRRLERVALALRAPRPLDVRAAALELVLAAAADRPLGLVYVTRALRAVGPRELRRVCWQRLRALAGARPPLAALLRALDPRPADWLRRAHDGTSSVLARAAAGAGAGWARLDSAQLASAGVLSRGAVTLTAHAPDEELHLLTVEVWTRGLESFATAPALPPAAREPEDEPAGEGEGEAEDAVEGGLALTVDGVRRPDLTLFSGQGELLGHIWAGTGSAPTSVLRALLPRVPRAHAYALGGGVVLRGRTRRALALALSAQAQVSLWGRTARAGLALRAAGLELGELRLRTAWGRVTAHARASVQPHLTIAAALDFYDKPQLCVHTASPDYTYSRNVTLESVLGGSALRVRRVRVTSLAMAGRTLALGAPNDAACAALGADHRD